MSNVKETVIRSIGSLRLIFLEVERLSLELNHLADELDIKHADGNIIQFPEIYTFPGKFPGKSTDMPNPSEDLPKPADLQLNSNSAKCKAISIQEKEEEIMPKIQNVHIYSRKNGYIQAVYYKAGIKKCFTYKNKKDLIRKVKEFIASEKLRSGENLNKTSFNSLSELWLNTIKKPFISDIYYQSLLSVYRLHVEPKFKKKLVKDISPIFLQDFFAKLTENSSRNAETVKTIVKGVLEYAVGNGIIAVNPMRAVIVKRHERQNGRALERDELEKFKKDIETRTTYRLPFLIFLYTGVRRSEYRTIEFNFEKGFLTVKNSKLKQHQKNFYREIPILPALRALRAEIEEGKWKDVYIDEVGKTFPKLVPGGSLKWLRHTFQTYCRLYADEGMVNLWAGHVIGKSTTDRVYLHYPKEDQLKIAETISF